MEELLDILLQQVEDTDPNAIADTITVLMPLIQSGNWTAAEEKNLKIAKVIILLHPANQYKTVFQLKNTSQK